MHVQINNLIEKNTNRVFDAVVAEEGLYLLHVTNTDGMQDYDGGSVDRFVMQGSSTRQYADQLADGTERLSDQLNDELLKNVHSRYITFPEIEQVALSPDAPRELRLKTEKGNFTLTLANTPPDEAQRFFDMLHDRVETEHAGQQRNR